MRAFKELVGSVTWVVLDPGPGALGQDLDRIIGRAPSEILVDMTHCGSIDSVDATTLCRHLWRARSRGSKIVLGGVRRAMSRFVKTSGLSEYFPCEERLPDALARFRGETYHMLGEMLVENGRLDEFQLEKALSIQAGEASPRRLGEILAEQGFVSQSSLIRVLFRQKMHKLAA